VEGSRSWLHGQWRWCSWGRRRSEWEEVVLCCVCEGEERMRRGWAATRRVKDLLDSHPRTWGSGTTRRCVRDKKLACSAGWTRNLLTDCPPGLADCLPGALRQQHSPLSRNLSNYSNNLESRLDVYDLRHLGYNTWFFKKTSHKMTMLTNSIQTIKKIQDFHKQSMHYFENHFVLKSLPLDKQVWNTSFHIFRINDV
jgi:hypothetical protein